LRSNEPNPVNVYKNPGNYEVTLTIFDVHGKTSSATGTVKVLDPRIQANFIWGNSVDLTVQFTDISAGEGITFWEWNFNDGSGFAYEQHPVHTFPFCGEYIVTLKISNGIYTSTKYKSVTVL
jgi:PKD repeat protein